MRNWRWAIITRALRGSEGKGCPRVIPTPRSPSFRDVGRSAGISPWKNTLCGFSGSYRIVMAQMGLTFLTVTMLLLS